MKYKNKILNFLRKEFGPENYRKGARNFAVCSVV
jgi:hypothetical protein